MALLLGFALRGVFLDVALPYGDPLDEPFHYAYASFLAQTGRAPRAKEPSVPLDALRPMAWLPRSTTYGPPPLPWKDFASLPPSERREARVNAYRYREVERETFVAPNYEAQHPPLFYLCAAAILRGFASARLDLRLLVLRIFATACAVLAVPLTYRFFRKLLAKRAAIAATAAMVALPGVSSLVGRFSNDALALPLAAALLILLVDVSRGRLDGRRALVLALVLAAGCWTKLYFLTLLPAALLASLLAPERRRRATLGRAIAACSLAFVLFLPWLVRQYRDTGDWLGLTPSKTASALGVGMVARIQALPDLFRWRYGIVFGRTFLWPGTWSAMGAPAAAAVVLTAGLLALFVAPAFSRRSASEQVRRGGLACAIAIGLFLLGDLLYSATFAAIARARGISFSPMGLGWYAAVLTPAVLSAGCLFGRAAPARLFRGLAVLSLIVGWWLDLSILPGVYSGRNPFNGANVPVSELGHQIFSPLGAMRIYETVGLISVAAPLLGLLWLSAQGALVLGIGIAVVPGARHR